MRMKKRGPHVLYDLNDLLFSLQLEQVTLSVELERMSHFIKI